jgi:hypothetical protein
VHEHGLAAARCFANHQPEQGYAHFAQLDQASAEVLKVLDEIVKNFSDAT